MSLILKQHLRKLGASGPVVPRLGLGLMGLSGIYGNPAADEQRLQFLTQAYDAGETFWDTADEYKDSEDLLGKWFAANPDKRKDIVLGTKFGVRSNVDAGIKGLNIDSSPEYCRLALDKSLKRLGLPFVDIYYIHRVDKVTPIEKTIRAMVELKTEGKIKYIGLSECSAATLRRAHAIHPITCVQLEYSAFCLAIESEQVNLLNTARELGVSIVSYSPMGNGFITGSLLKKEDFSKPGDSRAALPWLKDEHLASNVAIVSKLGDMAKEKGLTTPQLALAWVLHQGDDIFAIPGTSNMLHLRDNLGSLSVSLTDAEDKAVRQLSADVVGGRVQSLTGFDFGDTPALNE